MEYLLSLLKIIIVGTYIFFFFKSCKKGFLMEGIIIASLYSTVTTMIGQESGKAIVTLFLYFIITLLAIKQKRRNPLNRTLGIKIFGIAIFLLFIQIIISAFISPAVGYHYYDDKMTFILIDFFIPCFLFIIFGFSCDNNIKFLFNFFEIVALLMAVLLLLNAYKIGIDSIFISKFMKRVGVGNLNVIWTGRFISVGFLLVLLTDEWGTIKMAKLLVFMVAMILTGSKAVVFFPVIILILYILFFNQNNFIKYKIKLIALLPLIIIGFAIFVSNFNPEAIERRFSLESTTIASRENSIQIVFDQFMNSGNFIFGNGFATAGYPIIGNYDTVFYPHNITVELLYELGLVGLLFYYFLLSIPFWNHKKNKLINKNISIHKTIILMFILYAQTSGNMVGNAFLFTLTGYLIVIMSFTDKNYSQPKLR
jgi:O-antigen ligase